MGNDSISKTITLKDCVSETLRQMTKETMRYNRGLRQLRQQGCKTWVKLKLGAVGLMGVLSGGAGLIAATNDWANAARAQIDVETKLQAVLSHTPNMTQAGIDGIKKYAGELQNLGIIGDEVALAGVQQLGTYQLQASTLKKLMPGMNDLLSQTKGLNATQGDAVNIGNLLGKAMTGQVGALSRVGISFSQAQAQILKFGSETQRASVLANVLQKNVGGVNAALAATDQGRIQQASNAVGDLKEILGGSILQIKSKFADAFIANLPLIQGAIHNIAESMLQWAQNGGIDRFVAGLGQVIEVLGGVWDAGMGVHNLFWNNWSLISPIVYGVVGSLVAYKMAVKGAKAWTLATATAQKVLTWWTVCYGSASVATSGKVRILTLAQMGLNAAWRANPIGVIITLLGLLVTATIYVVKNWDKVKLKAMEFWNTVIDTAQWAVNTYIGLCDVIIRAYIFAWDAIKASAILRWNLIVYAAEVCMNELIKDANKIVKAFTFTWDAIKAAGCLLWNFIVYTAEVGVNGLIEDANTIAKAFTYTWDAIKAVGCLLWNSLITVAQIGTNKLIETADTVLKAFKFAWAWVEFGGTAMWKGILVAAETGVNGFIGLVESLIKKALDGVNILIQGVNKASNLVGMDSMLDEVSFGGLKRIELGSAQVKLETPKWKDMKNTFAPVDFGAAKVKTKVPKWSNQKDMFSPMNVSAAKLKIDVPKWGKQKDTFSPVNFGAAKAKVELPKWRKERLFGEVNFKRAKFGEENFRTRRQKIIEKAKGKKEKDKMRENPHGNLVNALNQNTQAMNQNTKETKKNTKETKKNTDKLQDNRSPLDIADGLLGRIERHIWSTT